MILEAEFLMPDYYPQFSCKMGACRTACCEGWPISLSVADYFRLLGTDCSPELRKKLDCGMHLMDHPIPEAYAQISPRYDGECPMRLADGRCGIQAELGEDALAAVCRLYPRGIRVDGVQECSCTNSCEGVLELLLNKDDPISFLHRQLSVSLPDIQSVSDRLESVEKEQEIRLWLLMRYLCLGDDAKTTESIVDVMAAIFRLVDHTDFDRYAAQTLKKMDCERIESIWKLICL